MRNPLKHFYDAKFSVNQNLICSIHLITLSFWNERLANSSSTEIKLKIIKTYFQNQWIHAPLPYIIISNWQFLDILTQNLSDLSMIS